jgi:hypothetical protein
MPDVKRSARIRAAPVHTTEIAFEKDTIAQIDNRTDCFVFIHFGIQRLAQRDDPLPPGPPQLGSALWPLPVQVIENTQSLRCRNNDRGPLATPGAPCTTGRAAKLRLPAKQKLLDRAIECRVLVDHTSARRYDRATFTAS